MMDNHYMMESHHIIIWWKVIILWLFSIILYSYKLYYCQIYLPYLWHFATLVLCTWLHPINMPKNISDRLSCYLKHIPFCQIIPPVYLQCQPCLWIGECFYGTLVWDSNDGHTGILSPNPNISNFPNQIKTTKQGRKPYLLPMLILSQKNLV